MTADMQERTAPGPAVDPRDQALFMPRPGEPVLAYAERLRVLRGSLDTLIASVERGAQARSSASRLATPRPPGTRTVGNGPAAGTRIVPRSPDAVVAGERRWAVERRQRLTERRIAPDRRIGRRDTRSHANERRTGPADRRDGLPDRRVRDRRAAVPPPPSTVRDPMAWMWVAQVAAWVAVVVAALALT